MRRNQKFRRIIGFVLISVMLTIAVNRFNLKLEFFEDLQHKTSQKTFFSADDKGATHGLKDLKKPVYSVSDYVSSCGDNHCLPAYNPQISCLIFSGPFKTVPEVYLEIFVPPDSLA